LFKTFLFTGGLAFLAECTPAKTRHNIGWMVLDRLADRAGWSGRGRQRDAANVVMGRFRGLDVTLVKPMTYMNDSGLAVRKVLARDGERVDRLRREPRVRDPGLVQDRRERAVDEGGQAAHGRPLDHEVEGLTLLGGHLGPGRDRVLEQGQGPARLEDPAQLRQARRWSKAWTSVSMV
jgi:hypothetical protein